MALTAFRKVQIGQESSVAGVQAKGTAVAAEHTLYGTLTMTQDLGLHTPQDERGSLATHYRDVGVAHGGRARFQGDATYEQIMHFVVMTLDTDGVTPTTPTNGVLTRDYVVKPSLVAANAQDSYTFEFGDDVVAMEMKYIQCTSFELGMAMGGPLSISADLFGHLPIEAALTDLSASQAVVNEILADGAEFWIDSTWANLGTTPFAAMLVGGTIRFNSGLVPVKYADGSAAVVPYSGASIEAAQFSATRETRRAACVMDLDIICTTDFQAQVHRAYIDRTDRAIRIKFTQTGTDNRIEAVTPDYYRHLEIDAFGRFTSPPEIFGERDGEDLCRMTFTSYDDGLTTGEGSGGNEVSVTARMCTTELALKDTTRSGL